MAITKKVFRIFKPLRESSKKFQTQDLMDIIKP